MSRQRSLTPLFATLVAAFALSACSKQDEQPTAGQQVDAAISKAERKADEARADADRAVADAKQTATQAVQDVKQGAEAAGAKVASVVTDATITASVSAELARDGKLDTTKIDVDTSRGRVALRGTAPDSDSRERARRIALAVKGVTAVDNYLTVSPKG